MEQYNRGPFADWVPKIIQLLLLVVYAIVFFNMSAIYTTNISYLVGETGDLTEYFMWSNYAMTIGMGVAMPLIIKIKAYFKSKQIMIFSLVVLTILLLALSETREGILFVGLCLVFGFFKMLAMMEINLPLLSVLSKDGNKGRFYAIFYTFVLIFTQLSGYYAVEISQQFGWINIYYCLAIACVFLILLSLIFQHNLHFFRRVPLYDVDWLSAIIYGAGLMTLAYVLSFGKQQNWFESIKIVNASGLFIVLIFLFIIRQKILKRPYLSLEPFKKRSVVSGLIFLSFLGVFLSTASFQTTYVVGILGYDLLANAYLNVLMIPGLVLALFISLKWFSVQLPVKMLIFIGFSAFTAYAYLMSIFFAEQFSYENWYILQFLKGLGMGILFIVIWKHSLEGLSIQGMLWVIGVILVWRTFVSLGISSAILGWFQYQYQLQSISTIGSAYDFTNLFQFKSSVIKEVQISAILVSLKQIFSLITILGACALGYVLIYDLK